MDGELTRAVETTDALLTAQPTLEQKKQRAGCLSPLVSLVVLLVLAALLFPQFVRSRSRNSLTACKSNLKNIALALEMYATDHQGEFPNSLASLTPAYLKTFPECPVAANTTYGVAFGKYAPLNSDGYDDYYYLECHGENHTAVSVTGNYPAYSNVQGLIERAP